MSVMALLGELSRIGRNAATGGYDRSAWTREDADCRAWFAQCADNLGLDLETDRNGNLWAWWHPEIAGNAIAVGSHLDSVPSGGAYDGPLGVASAFAAIEGLKADGFVPNRPVAVVVFADEEGARFGVACAGSRLFTGALDPDRARTLRDVDGMSLAEAMTGAGNNPLHLGRDTERLERVGEFIELHVEQGHLPAVDGSRGLGASPIGLATRIWPHGRWRIDLAGEQNHAGTTLLADRHDPMLALAGVILAVRSSAEAVGALATVGKVRIEPGAVNAIPGEVSAWVDARAADEASVRRTIAAVARDSGVAPFEESWTDATPFDASLAAALAAPLAGIAGRELPLLPSGAGHDAGILALAGIRTAMILVRNPSGISHAPAEFAEDADCELGAAALAEAIRVRTTLA